MTLVLAAATPKQIRELMQVDGLTNDEVKSHLQVSHFIFFCSAYSSYFLLSNFASLPLCPNLNHLEPGINYGNLWPFPEIQASHTKNPHCCSSADKPTSMCFGRSVAIWGAIRWCHCIKGEQLPVGISPRPPAVMWKHRGYFNCWRGWHGRWRGLQVGEL